MGLLNYRKFYLVPADTSQPPINYNYTAVDTIHVQNQIRDQSKHICNTQSSPDSVPVGVQHIGPPVVRQNASTSIPIQNKAAYPSFENQGLRPQIQARETEQARQAIPTRKETNVAPHLNNGQINGVPNIEIQGVQQNVTPNQPRKSMAPVRTVPRTVQNVIPNNNAMATTTPIDATAKNNELDVSPIKSTSKTPLANSTPVKRLRLPNPYDYGFNQALAKYNNVQRYKNQPLPLAQLAKERLNENAINPRGTLANIPQATTVAKSTGAIPKQREKLNVTNKDSESNNINNINKELDNNAQLENDVNNITTDSSFFADNPANRRAITPVPFNLSSDSTSSNEESSINDSLDASLIKSLVSSQKNMFGDLALKLTKLHQVVEARAKQLPENEAQILISNYRTYVNNILSNSVKHVLNRPESQTFLPQHFEILFNKMNVGSGVDNMYRKHFKDSLDPAMKHSSNGLLNYSDPEIERLLSLPSNVPSTIGTEPQSPQFNKYKDFWNIKRSINTLNTLNSPEQRVKVDESEKETPISTLPELEAAMAPIKYRRDMEGTLHSLANYVNVLRDNVPQTDLPKVYKKVSNELSDLNDSIDPGPKDMYQKSLDSIEEYA